MRNMGIQVVEIANVAPHRVVRVLVVRNPILLEISKVLQRPQMRRFFDLPVREGRALLLRN